MSYSPENSNIEPATSVATSGRKGPGPGPVIIAFGVIALLAVVFFFQNSEVTYIDFLIFEKRTTIRWSIMMAVILGVVLDRLFSNWWRRRKSSKSTK